MKPEERLEKLLDLINELIRLNSEIPVIVEGKKDERTLREIGLRGKVVRLNKGVSIFSTCEKLSREYEKVILLTDWDRRGGHLAKLLKGGLEANGVKYDGDIRAKMAALAKKDIKDVEGLERYLNRLRRMAESGVGGFK